MSGCFIGRLHSPCVCPWTLALGGRGPTLTTNRMSVYIFHRHWHYKYYLLLCCMVGWGPKHRWVFEHVIDKAARRENIVGMWSSNRWASKAIDELADRQLWNNSNDGNRVWQNIIHKYVCVYIYIYIYTFRHGNRQDFMVCVVDNIQQCLMVSVVAGNMLFLYGFHLWLFYRFRRGRKTFLYGFRRWILGGFCRRRRIQHFRTYRAIS